MSEAISEMIGEARGEDLRFGFEAAKGTGMDDAVAVARVVVTIRMRRFGKTTAAGLPHVHGIRSERRVRHGNSGFSGKKRKALIGAIGDGCIGVIGLDLGEKFGG